MYENEFQTLKSVTRPRLPTALQIRGPRTPWSLGQSKMHTTQRQNTMLTEKDQGFLIKTTRINPSNHWYGIQPISLMAI